MKKLFFIFFAVLIFVVACYSQNSKRFSFSINSGLNLSHYHLNNNNGNVSYSGLFSNIISTNIKLLVNYKIADNFIVQSGLGFTGMGSDNKSYGVWFYEKSTTKPYYLEAPLNILFVHKLYKRLLFFCGTGASFYKGVLGKNEYEGYAGDIILYHYSGKENIQFRNSPTQQSSSVFGVLKNFDFGINILGGINYKRWSLSSQYVFGMYDVSPFADDRGKNRTICFILGYRMF